MMMEFKKLEESFMNPTFPDQFKKDNKDYKQFGFLFNCTTVGQASYLLTVLTYSFNPLVGACCLSLAGPTIVQSEVFFSSNYL